MKTVRLTMAQALIRYLVAQMLMDEKKKVPLFAGAFAIFGHGNVAGLGEALFQVRRSLPTYRAHNEQTMAHAAIAYTKAMRRKQMMLCTSSIGPGATNMVTAAALAYVNRLPVLFLPGDIFATRQPDPVLQQSENEADPTASVNDCFRPVSRYWDRITRPEQLLQSLPQAISILTDPARCGPVTLSLPQDVQAYAYDYPADFFAPRVHSVRRQPPEERELKSVVEIIKKARKPFLIGGGGVLYSQAEKELTGFVARHRIPVGETQAGKGCLLWNNPFNMGAVGVTGTTAANRLANQADVVIAVGSRLQDFTTGSWALFKNPKMKLIQLNVNLMDTVKHHSLPLLADARIGLKTISKSLAAWKSPVSWQNIVQKEKAKWERISTRVCSYKGKELPSDAQVVEAVQQCANNKTTVVCAAGSLPAELHKHWRNRTHDGYHVEYGYSCMGYEIAGGMGVKMARPEREIIIVVGDGSYLMHNSELATSVMLGAKIILVVLDNRGYGCISRLQQACGGEMFNNLLEHKNTYHRLNNRIDFTQHAHSLGAAAEKLSHLQELPDALRRARKSPISYAVVIDTDPFISTSEGSSWWEVGVPEVSTMSSVRTSHRAQRQGKKEQKF